MRLRNRSIVVTAGGSGIGPALVERLALEGPRRITVVDADAEAAWAVAERVGGPAVAADLFCEVEAARVIGEVEARHGPIDLFCSNGGVAAPVGGLGHADLRGPDCWNILAVLSRGPGNRSSCLRPVAVETPRRSGVDDAARPTLQPRRMLAPATVADIVVEGLRSGRFMVLTHPETKERALVRVTHLGPCLRGPSQTGPAW